MSVTGKKHIFSSIEKKTFMDILERYSNIVESKETDGETLRAKNEAWHSITRVYNASPHSTIEVTNKQLRRLWMNLKQRQKEDQTKKRQASLPRPSSPIHLQQPREETTILDEEYRERQFRADQMHQLEMQVMRERLMEAKAKTMEAKAKTREAEAKAREAEAKAQLAEMELARKAQI